MMDSYTSMVKKLTDTKLYSVRTGGRTYAELKAFSTGLDLLFNELDEMLKEYFIDTAQSYGLTERERFTGAVRDDLSIEKRRELLKIREQTNEEFCTPEGFNKILEGYGLGNFKITENPSQNALSIKISDSLSELNKVWVNKMIEKDFPAHLEITVEFAKP
ncbi:putative phage tail protein [Ruminococcus sp.]